MEGLVITSIVGSVGWAVSLFIAQRKQDDFNYWRDPISHYIGEGAVLQIGFYLLALAVLMFAIIANGWATRALYLVGVLGTLGVVATKTFWHSTNRTHNVMAGMCYGGIILGDIVWATTSELPHHHVLLGMAVMMPLTAAYLDRIRSNVASQERIMAIQMLAWFWTVDVMLLV